MGIRLVALFLLAPATLCAFMWLHYQFSMPRVFDKGDGDYRISLHAGTQRDIQARWDRLMPLSDKKVRAFAHMTPLKRSCAIHYPIPADPMNPTDQELQTLGHEVWHCRYGHWHP